MILTSTGALVVTELSDCPLDPSGVRPIELADPVRFGDSIDADLCLLRTLRALTSHTVRVRWRLAGQLTLPMRDHVHLVPPVDGVDQASAAVAGQWRAGYRYGACYYRLGPDFVTVKDIRPGGEQARMVIDGDGVTVFRMLCEGHDIGELDSAASAGLDTLTGLGLASRGDREYLLLPYRMRHWPVPYVAV